MSRSRPASSPIFYHRQTNQYYVTRGGRRIYLGSDREQALKRYHEIGLGMQMTVPEEPPQVAMTLKGLQECTENVLKPDGPKPLLLRILEGHSYE
jgi:hypothetical protein